LRTPRGHAAGSPMPPKGSPSSKRRRVVPDDSSSGEEGDDATVTPGRSSPPIPTPEAIGPAPPAPSSTKPGIEANLAEYPQLLKYFSQRHRFWSKYDEGVAMDEESWYSVTPESIAEHTARRTKALFPEADVIIDAFSGPGGNSIQFARFFRRVIAIDIDPVKLACARWNAQIYGVRDKIEYIQGSYFDLLPRLKADVVFLSPPWGGPEYSHCAHFDLREMMMYDGVDIFQKTVRHITPNIIYFLPRNVLPEQAAKLTAYGEVCECEYNWLIDKVKSLTCYYGRTVDYYGMFNSQVPYGAYRRVGYGGRGGRARGMGSRGGKCPGNWTKGRSKATRTPPPPDPSGADSR
jgi:trimethylguanosine synthase